MKVKIVNAFKDERTGVIHGAGEEVEFTEERVKEIEENTAKLIKDKKIKKGTVLIKKIEKQDDSEVKATAKKKKTDAKKETESK